MKMSQTLIDLLLLRLAFFFSVYVWFNFDFVLRRYSIIYFRGSYKWQPLKVKIDFYTKIFINLYH